MTSDNEALRRQAEFLSMVRNRIKSVTETSPEKPGTTTASVDEPFAKKQKEIESRLLDANAKAKENENREADQRYWLRNIAVAAVIGIIVGMACMLIHIGYYILTPKVAKVSSSFLVVVFAAPILSMTTMGLALLMAAFRGYKDNDGVAGATMLGEAARASGITGGN